MLAKGHADECKVGTVDEEEYEMERIIKQVRAVPQVRLMRHPHLLRAMTTQLFLLILSLMLARAISMSARGLTEFLSLDPTSVSVYQCALYGLSPVPAPQRSSRRGIEYLVKWVGWPAEDSTWELASAFEGGCEDTLMVRCHRPKRVRHSSVPPGLVQYPERLLVHVQDWLKEQRKLNMAQEQRKLNSNSHGDKREREATVTSGRKAGEKLGGKASAEMGAEADAKADAKAVTKAAEKANGELRGKVGDKVGGKAEGKAAEKVGGKAEGKAGEKVGGKAEGKAGEKLGGKGVGKLGGKAKGKVGEKVGGKVRSCMGNVAYAATERPGAKRKRVTWAAGSGRSERDVSEEETAEEEAVDEVSLVDDEADDVETVDVAPHTALRLPAETVDVAPHTVARLPAETVDVAPHTVARLAEEEEEELSEVTVLGERAVGVMCPLAEPVAAAAACERLREGGGAREAGGVPREGLAEGLESRATVAAKGAAGAAFELDEQTPMLEAPEHPVGKKPLTPPTDKAAASAVEPAPPAAVVLTGGLLSASLLNLKSCVRSEEELEDDAQWGYGAEDEVDIGYGDEGGDDYVY